jgi:glycosyltransferase involved in cell wall biosynthesis
LLESSTTLFLSGTQTREAIRAIRVRGRIIMQFHVLSFEGPDAYSRAGGLATRVEGLTETLAGLGFSTHLWFVGDPDLPGHETRGGLRLHRWAQWLSRFHRGGVYDGECGKQLEFATSLPPCLLRDVLLPYLQRGGRAVVLAEEWQTVDAVLGLHRLLKRAGVRERVALLWNANNVFGFEGIDWDQLSQAAVITTVSRYMKHLMQGHGVDPLVIPNGLGTDAFEPPERGACTEFRRRFFHQTIVTKMARWDPAKRWLGTVEIVAEMKRAGLHPILIARGGSEPHGAEVLAAMEAQGLRRADRECRQPGAGGLLEALRDVEDVDVVNLLSAVDPEARRMLFRSAAAVLANSHHEPFGLVGLETMAAGGIACTGCSGEDYAVPGQNALVLETEDPKEFLGLFRRLLSQPRRVTSLRREGQRTARRFAWPQVVEGVLLPRVELAFKENPTVNGSREFIVMPPAVNGMNGEPASLAATRPNGKSRQLLSQLGSSCREARAGTLPA